MCAPLVIATEQLLCHGLAPGRGKAVRRSPQAGAARAAAQSPTARSAASEYWS
jgi:hypothetical protein